MIQHAILMVVLNWYTLSSKKWKGYRKHLYIFWPLLHRLAPGNLCWLSFVGHVNSLQGKAFVFSENGSEITETNWHLVIAVMLYLLKQEWDIKNHNSHYYYGNSVNRTLWGFIICNQTKLGYWWAVLDCVSLVEKMNTENINMEFELFDWSTGTIIW